MKTIIHVVQHLQPGGIETMVLELLRYADANHRVVIVSLEGKREVAITNWSRLREYEKDLVFLDKPAGWRLGYIRKLARLLRCYEPAAVHTHHIGPMIYGGLAARLAGVHRLVHTEHDAWHLQSRKRRCLQALAMRLVRPVIIADAEFVKKSLCHYFPGIDVEVILNGIDSDYFQPGCKQTARRQLGLPDEAILLGTAGRMEPVKAQDRLIRAITTLPENVHLAIAGDGSLRRSLHNLVAALNLQSRVHFTGRLDDMRAFYQSLDVFCLPSDKEGMPLSVLEAQACAVPAITTDVGGCREALCQETGRLVADNAVHKLEQAIQDQLIAMRTHKCSPREFVVEHGDMRRVSNSYIQLYETSVNGACL